MVDSSSSDENPPRGPSSSDEDYCPNHQLNEQLRNRERELFEELLPVPTEPENPLQAHAFTEPHWPTATEENNSEQRSETDPEDLVTLDRTSTEYDTPGKGSPHTSSAETHIPCLEDPSISDITSSSEENTVLL